MTAYQVLEKRYTSAGIVLTDEEKQILRVVARRSENEKGWKLEVSAKITDQKKA